VLSSFGHLIRYHLGTVCFGSLLIATLQMIRTILKLVQVIQNGLESFSN